MMPEPYEAQVLRTPFHSRTAAICRANDLSTWAGYTTVNVFTSVVITGIFIYLLAASRMKAIETIAFALLVSGGIGNLIDRITRDGLAVRMADEDWQAVIDVNLTAGFRIVRSALRGMMKQRWGRIIAITSVVGATGNPGQVNSAAAKAGMVGMTKALAQEVASRGITANCIAPGMIETAMTDALGEAAREEDEE